MRIVYSNISYHPNVKIGRNAHVYQFIRNARELGHEVWSGPGVFHPDINRLPDNFLAKLVALRRCDAVLYRIEDLAPRQFYWMDTLTSLAIGSPKFVWEFNTVPEFGQLVGRKRRDVDGQIQKFRRYAAACDLAVCVSEKTSEYVRAELKVKNVITVPNGSDPQLFRPDCAKVPRARGFSSCLNVVWIGSAGLDWVDFEVLKNAARLLWDSKLQNKVMFHVIGPGMPCMSGLPVNIQYHGAELYEKLPGWLAAMDVGLVCYKPGPSEYSSPLKFFDYLAAGLAVVTTGQPQVCKILTDMGQKGSALRHGDVEGLVERLKAFLEKPEMLREFKVSSRIAAVSKYNWKTTVKTVIDAIQQA